MYRQIINTLISIVFIISSISVSGQEITQLIGKPIIVPGDNPYELLYTRQTLKKLKFDDKYRYTGSIINKPLVIDSVFVAYPNKPKKSGLVLEIHTDNESIVMFYPFRSEYPNYGDTTVFSNPLYFPEKGTEEIGWFHVYQNVNEHQVRLPHLFVSQLDSLQNMIDKTFYYKKYQNSYYKIKFLDFIKADNGFSSIKVLEGETGREPEEKTYQIAYALADEYNKRSSGHTLICDSYHFFHFNEFMPVCISEETLVDSVKNTARYQYLQGFVNINKGKKLHFYKQDSNSDKYKYAFHLSSPEYKHTIPEGTYIINDISILPYVKENSMLPEYDTFLIINKLGENEQFAYWVPETTIDSIIVSEEEYNNRIEQERLEQERTERERQARYEREEREEYNKLVRRFGASNARLISEGEIRLGFTKAMVEESWGSPADITTVTNQMGTIECWIYGYSSFVYFRGNKVVQIIN